jgi:high-affinity iron transporter
LITTGILLGVVLLVMVGEQAQEMQLANWISTTPITWLAHSIPPWMSLWFALFPTYETMAAQFLAALLVIGSYYAAKRFGAVPLAGADSVGEAKRVSIDNGIVKPLQAAR